MFRYERMKVRLSLLKNHWKSMSNVIKTKNPSLFLSIVKGNTEKQPSFK